MENNIIKNFEYIIVKNVKCGKYKEKKDVKDLIKYITGHSIIEKHQKTVRYTGGYGVHTCDPVLCYNDMYIIKKIYKKTTSKNRSIYHFVISFSEYIEDANTVKLISIDICHHFYEQGFQCMYGVHEDTENLHIHIAVNSTNFKTGRQMHLKYNELNNIITGLKKLAYNILKENGY